MLRVIFFMIPFLMALPSGAQSWTLRDSGAGLIIVDTNAVRQVRVIRRNTVWDLKELIEKGALEGKYNGNQLFTSWIQGPETKEFLNSKRKPVWMYRYRIVYPDGIIYDSKPQEFLSSGYSFFGLKTGNYKEGVWKVEWFLVNRDNNRESQVATTIFETFWGNAQKKNSLKIVK
ncbi:MAG: hypothetical protein HZB98_07455 [Bacteroidia bacterium]|nr:hypothetical protein [Bacteroidia bacterium]